MTDPGFVIAAYVVVITGLVAYSAAVSRQRRRVRRTAHAIRREASARQAAQAPDGPGQLQPGPDR